MVIRLNRLARQLRLALGNPLVLYHKWNKGLHIELERLSTFWEPCEAIVKKYYILEQGIEIAPWVTTVSFAPSTDMVSQIYFDCRDHRTTSKSTCPDNRFSEDKLSKRSMEYRRSWKFTRRPSGNRRSHSRRHRRPYVAPVQAIFQGKTPPKDAMF